MHEAGEPKGLNMIATLLIHQGGEPKGLHMITTVTYTRGMRTKGPTHDSHGSLYMREENQRAYT
jgi:hypothetical protein